MDLPQHRIAHRIALGGTIQAQVQNASGALEPNQIETGERSLGGGKGNQVGDADWS
ncbi:MAG: hypothetical protein ACKODB_08670 [Betaproteobacteria bacterium]